MLIGAYDLPQMKAMKSLTFPRVLVYGANGKLIERDSWPVELAELKRAAGDAFCCVSDKPSPPGWIGPPPDCKIVVYGEKVEEHFVGLKASDGRPINYAELPAHKLLIVEYYASWCAPCIPARKALQAYLGTPAAQDTIALVVDFTNLAPGK
jgi:thiol-disulfide isomerase/thioredoxin